MDIRIIPGIVRSKQYPWQVAGWVESAADHLNHINVAFDALGIDRVRILKDLHEDLGSLAVQFPEDFAPYGEHRAPRPQARYHATEAIKQFFTGVKVVEEDETIITRKLPLCVFDSPSVPKAKTTYAEGTSTDVTAGWSIEVLGTGFGSDVTLSVAQASEFMSSAGERKLIFAPLHIKVVRAALYKRGKLQERFLRAELFEPEARDANGVGSVTDADWQRLVGKGRVRERFDLSGDTSQSIVKYRRNYQLSGTFETSLGLSAFNLKSKVIAKCAAKQTTEFTFELPPGRLYELREPLSVAGFYFGP